MTAEPPAPRSSTLALTVYALMVIGAVGAFLWIRHLGGALAAPAPPPGPTFGSRQSGSGARVMSELLPHVLLALAVILIASRLLNLLFRRLGQPPVVGEVIAGLLLGPSLLGRLSPGTLDFLFPAPAVPYLSIIAQFGVILFMFLVGLEFDPEVMRGNTRSTIAISHASITLPFVLGTLIALPLYPLLATSDVPFTAFALFLGVSMSITAFPVLARILADRGIQSTRLGVMALTCAAVDDVTSWCLLAFVVSVVNTRTGSAWLTAALTLAYVALLLALRRPVARLLRARDHRGLTHGVLTAAFVALLGSALITEAIGVHAIFGAFLLGVIVPRESRIARELAGQFEAMVLLLLPAFFAATGLRTQIGRLHGADWLICGGIILVASFGKFGGSALAGRLTGLTWRDSASLGVLMNTRGLVELIVLNIGLDLHVLSPALFAMLVLMAVTTTVLTTPCLSWLQRGAWQAVPATATTTGGPRADAA
jgi:Kef-type K+ transport system membrane component KefB